MNIIKPKIDKRDYEYFILDNELEVVFINDIEANTSGVSLSVGCGSYENEIEGCAHFLEHMLFMGTEKYPDENYYKSFIDLHNGSTNAYTAHDHTNYYYTINPNYLEESLDIFSEFFISPLFNESSLLREINAVNSEHEKNVLNDYRRENQIITKLCVDNSPISKFATGTEETLNIKNIRNIIIDFYNKYYSSNIMKLVVYYSGHNKDSIINKIKSCFNNIINKKVIINRNTLDKHLITNKIVNILPINDINVYTFLFELDINTNIINYNLLSYIYYLLSHKGKNTLCNYLKKNAIIMNITINTAYRLDNKCIYKITFNLYDNDVNLNELIKLFFNYIKILYDSIDTQQFITILNEQQTLNDIDFEKCQIDSIIDYVSNMSENLIRYNYNREHILQYDFIIGNFLDNDVLINEFRNIFKNILDNDFTILHISKNINLTNNKLEKYYNIKYTINDLDLKIDNNNNVINNFNFPDIYKPIAQSHILLNDNQDTPINNIPMKIYEDNNIKYYLKKNFVSYDLITSIKILKNNIFDTPKNYIKYIVFNKVFELLYYDFLYNLDKNSYSLGIDIDKDNYEINISCNYLNITSILKQYIQYLKDFFNKNTDISDVNKKIIIIKKKLLEYYKNKLYSSPLEKLNDYKDLLLFNNTIKDELIIEELEKNITYDDIIDINLFNTSNIIIYTDGNINETYSLELFNLIKNEYVFNEKNNKLISINLKNINKTINKEILNNNSEETNNYINISYYISNIYKKALYNDDFVNTLIFNKIVSNLFFDTVRTKEQYGYYVASDYSIVGNYNEQYLVYEFNIMSSKTVNELEKRILEFVNNEIKKIINNISKDMLYHIKKSIKETLLVPPNNLTESFSFNYSLINNEIYMFNKKKIVAEQLENVTKKSLKNFYKKYLKKNKNIMILKLKNLNS